mmetsp:Transcript_141017/g.256336  ORF Transcript_141017/g.256336 Transcript_141017/m.256336 type:complete len:279 (+) Transcript_141017:56-892(+)
MKVSSSTNMAPQGLAQAELDSLSVFAEDCGEAPPSPLDDQLLRRKKNKRRITFSAIKAEISAVTSGDPIEQRLPNGGLSQEELDALSVDGPCEGTCQPDEPLDSVLHLAKRRRSVGDGAAGALARASELTSQTTGMASVAVIPPKRLTGGLSQASLDTLSVSAADAENSEDEENEDSMVFRKRRQRAFPSRVPQPVAEPAAVPAKSDEDCSTPPGKQGICSTPPRNKGADETKVPGSKSPDSAILGSPFSKSPESGKAYKSEDSGMQRSPLGSFNREL